MRTSFGTILELAKVKITVAVSLTTIAGFVLYYHGFSREILLPTLGIFLLACGSSAINQIQEYGLDQKMERTRRRPLPSGKISIGLAWAIAALFIISGCSIMWLTSPLTALVLGITALIWYNLVYTNLKRITYLAVIPGSVIGAIPPLVGWVTAGGPLWDEKTLAVAFFFFVWQVPHFWLLMVKYGNEYQKAGFPSITLKPKSGIKLMTFVWIVTTAIAALFLSYFRVVVSVISTIGIIISSAWIVYLFVRMMVIKEMELKPGKYFMKINYYILMVILLMLTDHLFLKYLL